MWKLILQAFAVISLTIRFSLSRRLGIVGGQLADFKAFPYQGAYLSNNKLKCGASIISEWCALTAGLCDSLLSSVQIASD